MNRTICGDSNYATGLYSFIGGGIRNQINGNKAVICGGDGNFATCNNAVCGGSQNSATGGHSFIGCGSSDSVKAEYSAIVGGYNNLIDTTAYMSSILGGNSGKIFGDYSVILSGKNSSIEKDFSLAFGAYVRVDSSNVVAFFKDTFEVVGGDTIFYRGKVGINQPNPTAELEVNGTVKINNVLKLVPSSDPPPASGSGDEGLMYYDTEDHMLYFYDGTDWRPCWEP